MLSHRVPDYKAGLHFNHNARHLTPNKASQTLTAPVFLDQLSPKAFHFDIRSNSQILGGSSQQMPGPPVCSLLPGGHQGPDLLCRQAVLEPQVAPQVGHPAADAATQRASRDARVDLAVVVQRVPGEVVAAADVAAIRGFWGQGQRRVRGLERI